jgi:large subunit ribosomal protein L6
MSRIGKSIIEIPAGVTVTVNDNVVTVKGLKENFLRKLQAELLLSKKMVK